MSRGPALASGGEVAGVRAGLVGGVLRTAQEAASASLPDDHHPRAARRADGRAGVARGAGAARDIADDDRKSTPAGLAAGRAVSDRRGVEAVEGAAARRLIKAACTAARAGGRALAPELPEAAQAGRLAESLIEI